MSQLHSMNYYSLLIGWRVCEARSQQGSGGNRVVQPHRSQPHHTPRDPQAGQPLQLGAERQSLDDERGEETGGTTQHTDRQSVSVSAAGKLIK